MKLNLDCMRDILKYCIEKQDFYEGMDDTWGIKYVDLPMLYNSDLKDEYPKKDIMYSIVKLEECHFIKIDDKYPQNAPYIERCSISDVTLSGHQFYESIKESSAWEKTKSIANKVGNHTIKFIEGVAHDIAVESAKQFVIISMQKSNS